MRSKKACFQVSLILAMGMFFLLARCADANEANYRSYAVGDRAAGMGGAACAIADDLDACFYNPAGLPLTKHNSVSFSASLYGFDRYRVTDAVYPGERLATDSFLTIPSSMGTVFSLSSDSAVAFSVFVPNKNTVSEMFSFWSDRHFYNFYIDDQTLWLGPSFGHSLSPELSIGASVFGTYRTYTYFESLYLGNYALAQSVNIKYDNAGLLALVGAQYRPDENWSFGATIQSPSLNLMGDGKMEYHYSLADKAYQDTDALYAEDMDSNNRIPARFTAGIAWQKPKRYALALDCCYSLPTSFMKLKGVAESGEEGEMEARLEPTFDVSVGAEYYLYEIIPLRCGFFTSMSAAPDPNEDSVYPAQIDLYGLTASVGIEKERIAMNIGVSYAFGDGKDLGWGADENGELVSTIVDASSRHIFLFLNTAYLF